MPSVGHRVGLMSPKRKNAAAVALGRRSVKGRMKKLTPVQRSEYARNAARARWGKAKKAKNERAKGGNGG